MDRYADGPPRRSLDRRGRILLGLSAIAPAMLLFSAAVFAIWGAEWFWQNVADPYGRAATTFSATVLVFAIFGVTSIAVLVAYAGAYRSAAIEEVDPDEIAAHWVGMMFIFVAAPYFAFGLFHYTELSGVLLLWGSLLALVVGLVYYWSPRIWPKPKGFTASPPDTR